MKTIFAYFIIFFAGYVFGIENNLSSPFGMGIIFWLVSMYGAIYPSLVSMDKEDQWIRLKKKLSSKKIK